MGPSIGPILNFLKAIFVGTGFLTTAGKTVGALYALSVNLARVALLAAVAKLTAPRLSLSKRAQVKTFTVRDPVAPQAFIYGQDMISGPIIFSNVCCTTNENRNLYVLIALTGHEVNAVLKYRIDDEDIQLSDLSGAFDGDVIGVANKFKDVATVDFAFGTSTQIAFTTLTNVFSGNFNAAHTGRGWSYMLWTFKLVEGLEDVFKNIPQNMRAVVQGKRIYDPRLDASPGADPQNASFIVYSDNPALCLSDFIRDDKFGMREEDDRMDWDMVVTAADVCDETVSVPSGLQNRYTCNATFFANERRGAVRDELLGAMMGRMVFSQGLWKMWAGEAVTSDVTLTEANLSGSIQMEASTPSRDRYNRVRGKFVDSARDYTANAYPEQRSSTFVTEDGGEVREIVADFTSTNNTFEAQRKAIITLKQSRNQRVIVFQGNYSCFRIQPGATITLDIAEYGFAGEKFFVTEWKLAPDGIELTLVEEVDSVWADPLVGDYTTRSETGVLTFGETGVPAPTAFSGAAVAGGFFLQWTNPPESMFDVIEIHVSDDNVRGNAIIVATTRADEYVDQTSAVQFKYYWIRARNAFGQVSDFTPDLTTTTINGAAISSINPPDFTGAFLYDDLDTTQLAAGQGRYAMLTARGTNTSGSQNNFQNTDGILINRAGTNGGVHTGFLGSLTVGERITYIVSNDRWYLFDIDEIFEPIGTGTAKAFKFGVTFVHQHDADPAVNIPTASGTNINFEFQRFESDADLTMVRDPDFDLSVALGVQADRFDFFWWQQYQLIRTEIAGDGGITFLAAGGGNGSNAVEFERSTVDWDGTGGFAQENGTLIATRRIRTNTPEFTVKVRWRNNTANTFESVSVRMTGYDDPRAGTVQAGPVTASLGALAPTGTTWQELTVNISGAGDPGAQYWQFEMHWTRNFTSSATASAIEIDSIFVYASEATFAGVDKGVGLVPEAITGDAPKFLQGDATWAVPAGSGGTLLQQDESISSTGWFRVATNSSTQGRGAAIISVSATGGNEAPDTLRFQVNKSWLSDGTDMSIVLLDASQHANTNIGVDQIRVTTDTTAGTFHVEIHITTIAASTYVVDVQPLFPGSSMDSWVADDFTAGATETFTHTWNIEADEAVMGFSAATEGLAMFTEQGGARFNRRTNNSTSISIGEPSVLRGDSQDSNIKLFGESGGSIRTMQIANTGANMSFSLGTGSIQISDVNAVQIFDGGAFEIFDSSNVDKVRFEHNGLDLLTTFTTTQDWNITGLTGGLSIDSNIGLGDNNELQLGAAVGGDAQLYHDGINTRLDIDTGGFLLRVASTELALTAFANGSVNLYYDNVLKLFTKAEGVEIAQSLYITEQVSANVDIGLRGQYWVRDDAPGQTPMWTGDDGIDIALNNTGGDMLLGTEQTITANKTYADNIELRFGDLAGGDAQFYHDGTNLRLDIDTGGFLLRLAATELAITAFANGSVNLYYNNVLTLQTKAEGVEITNSLYLTEQAAAQVDIGGRGQFWARDDNAPMFTTEAGVDIDLSDSNINISGTPVNNQLAVWLDADTLEGDANLTWSGTLLDVGADIGLGDNDELQLGAAAGGDAQFYHDGTNVRLDIDTGGFLLRVATTELAITAFANGSVNLYYNNVLKLFTKAEGIEIAESLYVTEQAAANADIGGRGQFWVRSTDNAPMFTTDGGVDIDLSEGEANVVDTVFGRTGAVVALTGDYSAFYTRPGDAEIITALWHFHSGLHVNDNDELQLGSAAGGDAQFYHDGTNLRIDIDTGGFLLRVTATELAITAFANGSVNLYYNNSLKLFTKAEGVEIAESLYVTEQTAANADVGLRGQYWVRNDAPGQTPMFTNDAGVDTELDALGGGAVDSVFGRTGAVAALTADYAAFYPQLSGAESISGVWTHTSNLILNTADLRMGDADEIQFGDAAGGDAHMVHTGALLLLDCDTGSFNIRMAANEIAIGMNQNGSVDLYEDGTLEFFTQDHNSADNITGAEVRHFGGTFYDVGLAVMPDITKSSALTISELHMHKVIRITNVSGDITFANDGGMKVDSCGWIINTTTSNQNLNNVSNNLEVFSGDGVANNTGDMTLAGKGWCTWYKFSDTEYHLVGVGLS